MFAGSLVALITPFKNGSVDEKGFEKFVGWQIKEGTDGLVPCGTTGESPTLSMEEHKRVIDICISAAKGSGVPNKDKVGKVTMAQVEEIARTKLPDLNTEDVKSAVKSVLGTARSMGIEVQG